VEVLSGSARTSAPGVRVVICSSSSAAADVNPAHALGIDGHVVKPVRLDEWVGIVDTLAVRWLRDG